MKLNVFAEEWEKQIGTCGRRGLAGANTQDVHLFGNNFHQAKVPYQFDPDVKPSGVTGSSNFLLAKEN